MRIVSLLILLLLPFNLFGMERSGNNKEWFVAAKNGDTEALAVMLKQDQNIDATDYESYTALHPAAKNGSAEAVSFLVSNGASLDYTTPWDGCTALHLAAERGYTSIVACLVEHGADFINNATQSRLAAFFPGYTALHIAVAKNHFDTVKLLIEKNAELNARTMRGNTPLHVAAKNDNAKIVEYLIEYGVDINAKVIEQLVGGRLLYYRVRIPFSKSYDGYTPLHLAAFCGHTKIAAYLLEHRADVNATAEHCYTPLHVAAQGGHTNIIAILVEHNADITATDEDGAAPLQWAAFNGHLETVKSLVAHGDDINDVDKCNYTSLHWAVQKGHFDIVEWLIKHGADIAAKNDDGKTAYELARKRKGKLKLLLQKHQKINMEFIKAVREGKSIDELQRLLERKADVNYTDKKGKSAYDHAIERRTLAQATADLIVEEEQKSKTRKALKDK